MKARLALVGIVLWLTTVPLLTSQEPANKNAEWIAYPHTIVQTEDITSSNRRSRARILVVSPSARTAESRAATMMKAAMDYQKATGNKFVMVFLTIHKAALKSHIGQINYAPDGCGVSGTDCTGEMWTDLKVSASQFSKEQAKIIGAWDKNEKRFRHDELGLRLHLAKVFGKSEKYIRDQIRDYSSKMYPSKSPDLSLVKSIIISPPEPEKRTLQLARVNTRFTGCFDSREVAKIFYEIQRYGHETVAARLHPAALAARECRWLEEGDIVRLIGNPYNAIINSQKGEIIEGISIFLCEDSKCQSFKKGVGNLGMWFPLDMLDDI